jgi:AraC family transcriptional regulator
LSFAEYRRDHPSSGFTTKTRTSQSYMAVVKLRALSSANMWCDQRHVLSPETPAGAFSLFDLRQAWSAEMSQPFHTVNFFVGQAVLNELADELGLRPIPDLAFNIAKCHRDEVMLNLSLGLLPALDKPWEVNRIFADHVAWAMNAHLMHTYGGVSRVVPMFRGGLSQVREKLAKELIDTNLGGGISMRDIAHACGLSPGHFARAFQRTTGMPPHRWLLSRRIERAKDLLLQTQSPVSEIAHRCGFADERHFTRVFSQAVGTTPGAWRNVRRN